MKVRNTKYPMYVLAIILLICQSIPAFSLTDSNGNKVPSSLLTPISVEFKNIPLKEAISIISEKGDFHLNYNEKIIPSDRKIFLKMDKVPAYEVLMNVLEGTGTGLTITSGGQIIIVPSANGKGEIKGKVIDKESRESLAGVNVIIPGTQLGAASRKDGRFQIRQIPAGIYTIEASMIGYERKRIENIIITENDTVEVTIELAEEALSLGEVIVTPGHFSLMESEPTSHNALKSEDLRDFPQLGEDIFRAVKRLPGLAGNDYSAKFAVRGGEHEEVLVMLDGMELYDPFHLKAIGGGLSIVDVELINNIDMITGAFPAEYGNKLSGVFNMKTRTPVLDKPRTSIALSFLNTRFLSEGNFNKGKGSWQLLARRGYIDYILKLTGDEDNTKPIFPILELKIAFICCHILLNYNK